MGAFRLGETATEFELAVNDSADRSTVKRATRRLGPLPQLYVSWTTGRRYLKDCSQ